MNIFLGASFIIILISFIFTVFRDIGITMIINPDALSIVLGGTFLALLVGFPVERLRSTYIDVINTFAKQRDKETVIKDIVEVSRIYRKDTIKTLEKRMESVNDSFLKLGVNLLINNHDKKEIKDIMEREMMLRLMNYNFSQNVLKTVARLTPSFGLAGTVISLVKMFRNFESFDTIAPYMAVALMSTLYGVIIANLIMLPLCAKVKEQTILSETVMRITIDGMLAINNRENPMKVEDKISGYQAMNENSQKQNDSTLVVPKRTGTA